MRNFVIVSFWLNAILLSAQSFQSASNPYYWKNKKPFPSYWQQDVDYKIDAYLDEKEEIISGNERILYTNNSPDTLHELFFNLYQNAFLKNSYLTKLQKANGVKIKFGKWEAQNKGNEILLLKVNGENCPTETDGTLMRVSLMKPILPNEKADIQVQFKTYYSVGGNTRRRMRSYLYQGKRHFNASLWYPRLAVYDRKFGWCTDQHLNREFYGDFGDFEVKLNFPASFVAEATGILQNEAEVFPKGLRDSLDISRFWGHKWDTTVTFKPKYDSGARKTWFYVGKNVHDFAWVAGPYFRLHDTTVGDLKVVALVLEPHSIGWKNACDYTLKVIQTYNRDIGKYAYPKMVVADAGDGMEYPMLTMDGGRDPGYRGLLAHEVGHNWFYGMVNNNETYRALLDEGFTQFLTVWSQEAIDGKYEAYDTTGWTERQKKHYKPIPVRESDAYWGYIRDALMYDDAVINTHSDGFNGALAHGGGYRHVYMKTATMLYNLQYVLGDSLFLGAMKNYFREWSFCHPYIEDFRQSVIRYTHVDLNWFFDEWLETTKNIDYKIRLKSADSTGKYTLKITRKGEMQMPLDLNLKGESGRTYNYYIPNTWFQKKTDATVLPRWIGWDSKFNNTYETPITTPEKIVFATIDTTRRLADINELNNSTHFPLKTQFEDFETPMLDRHHYNVKWRPDLWYNNFDGVKLGAHFDGNYMRVKHNLSFDFWVNTTIGKGLVRENIYGNSQNDPFSVRLQYSTPTERLMKNSRFDFYGQWLDGVVKGKVGFTKRFNDIWSANIHYLLLMKPTYGTYNYFYQPDAWGQGGLNGSLNLEVNYQNTYFHELHHRFYVKARGTVLSYINYSFVETEHVLSMNIAHKLHWKNRFFGRIGLNSYSYNGRPNASMLNAGGANMEGMIQNEFMRSVFLIPNQMYDPATLGGNASNLQYGGGLNLRGYSMRNWVESGNTIYGLTNQNSGISYNTQLNFEQLSPLKAHKVSPYIGIETYLFGDVGNLGTMQLSGDWLRYDGSPWLVDAGAGVALNIKKFGNWSKIKPLYFRFDMPLYLNRPNLNDEGSTFKFRWLLGIEKAF